MHLEQLILELTGKCNLRCGYCIYNDDCDKNRNFNNEDITFECAKKAVDYFFDHSKEKMAVTFYGGEPLLKYNMLKEIINYCLNKNEIYKKELSFSLTTNLTLVTEEIAKYLSSIPGLSILCSIDGPKNVHDAYRKYHNGKGSFSDSIKGLKYICEYFDNKLNPVSINAVFAPPYTYEKLDEIEEFFTSLEFLPLNIQINITYPTLGSVNGEKWIEKMKQNPKYKSYNYTDISPLWKWQLMKQRKSDEINNYRSITSSGIDQILKRINDRYISDLPNNLYPFNGCCVPGTRRLYVDTNGQFYPCERIGKCPNIGDIVNGLDINKIKKYYVEDYMKKSIEHCSNCWAVRLCGICYAGRYDKNGFLPSNEVCEGARYVLERNLSYYHELLEGEASKLEYLKDIEIV